MLRFLITASTLLPVWSDAVGGRHGWDLTEKELQAYWQPRVHVQPTWDRGDLSNADNGKHHQLLQRASQLHQDGFLAKAVSELKTVLREDSTNAEAYASLAKILNDQGKFELANKAMVKVRRIMSERERYGNVI